MLKATQTRFALLVSMALTAACGGGTDSETSGASTPVAGSPATNTAGTPASSGSAGASGSKATTGSAGTGTGGTTATGAAGKAGSGAGGTTGSAGAGTAGSSAAGAGAAGSGAAAAPTFTAVYNALFSNTAAAGCFGCHGGMANPALNGGFAMNQDKATVYTNLVAAMSSDTGMCKGMTRVKASDPTSSLLYLKIAGTPPCGMEMPPGDKVDAATVTLVKDWITAGAKND